MEGQYRGPRPAVFIQKWVKRHCPKELRDATVRAVAEYYGVTEAPIRSWAKHDIVPRRGGYPRGLNGSKAKKAAVRPRKRAPPPPPPVEIKATPEQWREAFFSVLRHPAGLTRIFTAEIKP